MKISKFLPAKKDGRVFIIHTREPFIIAEAFHFDEDQEHKWMEGKFEVGASVDYPGELIVLGVHSICGGYDAEKLPKLMSRMGDWYYSYLKWEDD